MSLQKSFIATSGTRRGCGTRFHNPKPAKDGTPEHLTPNVAGVGCARPQPWNPPRISDRTWLALFLRWRDGCPLAAMLVQALEGRGGG